MTRFRITTNGVDYRIEVETLTTISTGCLTFLRGRSEWLPISEVPCYGNMIKCRYATPDAAQEGLDLLVKNFATLWSYEPIDDKVYEV